MGARRQSRTSRPREAPALKIQERDRWIFESLAKMGALSTTQLARLHFAGSAPATNKRLPALHRAGFVRAWVPNHNLAAENVYSLDRKGARLLAQAASVRARVPQGLDGTLQHTLVINDARIAVALALPGAGGELVFWKSDRELAGRSRERLVPDALFLVQWPDTAQSFALEVEHRTKAPQRFLQKIVRYQAFAGGGLYGVSDVITLVVATDASWLERYRLALVKAGLTFPVFFTPIEALKATPLDGIWMSPAVDVRYSLRNLPYRKEAMGDLSRQDDERSCPDGEGGTTMYPIVGIGTAR